MLLEDSQVKVIPLLQIYRNNIDSENLLRNGNDLVYLHLGHIGCRLDGIFLTANNSKSFKKDNQMRRDKT